MHRSYFPLVSFANASRIEGLVDSDLSGILEKMSVDFPALYEFTLKQEDLEVRRAAAFSYIGLREQALADEKVLVWPTEEQATKYCDIHGDPSTLAGFYSSNPHIMTAFYNRLRKTYPTSLNSMAAAETANGFLLSYGACLFTHRPEIFTDVVGSSVRKVTHPARLRFQRE